MWTKTKQWRQGQNVNENKAMAIFVFANRPHPKINRLVRDDAFVDRRNKLRLHKVDIEWKFEFNASFKVWHICLKLTENQHFIKIFVFMNKVFTINITVFTKLLDSTSILAHIIQMMHRSECVGRKCVHKVPLNGFRPNSKVPRAHNSTDPRIEPVHHLFYKMGPQKGSRTVTPWAITPRKITPQKTTPKGKLPPGILPPGESPPPPPRTTTPQGQLPPENYPPENFLPPPPEDSYPLGQLPPRTITP